MPDEAYHGLHYGSETHNHGELDKILKSYMDGVIGARTLSPVWNKGIAGILDSYLGEVPEKFQYNGKEYTPHSFAAELGLKQEDYISLTSFTHHPFTSLLPSKYLIIGAGHSLTTCLSMN